MIFLVLFNFNIKNSEPNKQGAHQAVDVGAESSVLVGPRDASQVHIRRPTDASSFVA
jgi:hypothetical protein